MTKGQTLIRTPLNCQFDLQYPLFQRMIENTAKIKQLPSMGNWKTLAVSQLPKVFERAN